MAPVGIRLHHTSLMYLSHDIAMQQSQPLTELDIRFLRAGGWKVYDFSGKYVVADWPGREGLSSFSYSHLAKYSGYGSGASRWMTC